ncbi:hypothetical protein [Pseudoalteromonas sp. 1_2015MBL_MicDiv]|uniref:hypothetical protein n=1 Tax=Pseudoalteromonas sp. 1_2015MBL_MicDiv TaxID=1720343 RepID=UPI000BC0726C|nr:hypothetical protein [Pseudoalteromonas sp. 1_2015MBL_MicDiv]ATG79945.1 hypothetical protein AOR04_20680 [Pseudoalteromonas sp. 1_2015MBL_MicDiv]
MLRTKNIRSFNIQGSILFFCLSLLSIGVIVGFTIKANSTTLDALYKAFGVISGIGTLLTALIASLALYTWKYQFSHGERFKAFKKLEEIALDCISAIEVYRGVYEDEHLSGNTRCYYDDHNKAKNKSRDTFRESIERYRKDVDFVQSLLTNEELTEFEFTYGNFNSKVHGILNSVSQSYEFNGEEQHKELLIVEKDILELKLKVKEHFRQFRGR